MPPAEAEKRGPRSGAGIGCRVTEATRTCVERPRTRRGRDGYYRRGDRFLGVFLILPAGSVFARRSTKALDSTTPRSRTLRRAVRFADFADGGDCGCAQPGFWARGIVGDHALRVSRQEPAHNADRLAVRVSPVYRGHDLSCCCSARRDGSADG